MISADVGMETGFAINIDILILYNDVKTDLMLLKLSTWSSA